MIPSKSNPHFDQYEENQAQLERQLKEALKVVTVPDLIEDEVMTIESLWCSLLGNVPEGILPTDKVAERCLTKMLTSLSVEECVSMLLVDEDDLLEYYVTHYICEPSKP